MTNIIKALLNALLISIPEEMFLVTMTLILLKRFDLLDIRVWRRNLKWFAISVIPVALVSDLLRYVIKTGNDITSLTVFILMMILICFVVLKNNYMNENKIIISLKIFFYVSLSFIILGVIESAYTPLVLFLIKRSITYINNNILYNFLLSSPSRILEFTLCFQILIKNNNPIKVNLFEIIIKNKFLKITFFMMIFFINIFIIYFTKLIGYNLILKNLGFLEQFLITILSVSLPVILLGYFLMIINYIVLKERQMKQTYENLVCKLED